MTVKSYDPDDYPPIFQLIRRHAAVTSTQVMCQIAFDAYKNQIFVSIILKATTLVKKGNFLLTFINQLHGWSTLLAHKR